MKRPLEGYHGGRIPWWDIAKTLVEGYQGHGGRLIWRWMVKALKNGSRYQTKARDVKKERKRENKFGREGGNFTRPIAEGTGVTWVDDEF